MLTPVRVVVTAALAAAALLAPLAAGAAAECPPLSECRPVEDVLRVVDDVVPDRCYWTEHGIYCEEDPA